MTNEQIGLAVHVTKDTVKTHIENIFIKMGVVNRAELAAVFSAGDAAITASQAGDIINQVREDLARPFYHLGSIQHYRQEGALMALDIAIKRIKEEGSKRARTPPGPGNWSGR